MPCSNNLAKLCYAMGLDHVPDTGLRRWTWPTRNVSVRFEHDTQAYCIERQIGQGRPGEDPEAWIYPSKRRRARYGAPEAELLRCSYALSALEHGDRGPNKACVDSTPL